VYRALSPGGEVLVYEVSPAEKEPSAETALFSLTLALDTKHGRVYLFEEIREWLAGCGFQDIECQPVTPATILIHARKPGPGVNQNLGAS
jgi:hypothetical protein